MATKGNRKHGTEDAGDDEAMEDEGDEKFKEYLSDGLHFSHKGGIFFIEKLKPFLDKNIDQLQTTFFIHYIFFMS